MNRFGYDAAYDPWNHKCFAVFEDTGTKFNFVYNVPTEQVAQETVDRLNKEYRDKLMGENIMSNGIKSNIKLLDEISIRLCLELAYSGLTCNNIESLDQACRLITTVLCELNDRLAMETQNEH